MDFSHLNEHLFPGSQVSEHPKVSVCLITYKHEPFLETCLESIISQQVNFPFEILIGEDHSPDQTAAIVEKYALKYPHLIKAFIRPKNVGSKFNFVHCFLECRGEYIVHIEGDDYWTDTNKVQRQVDFLDQHPNASACFHNATIVFEDGSGKSPQIINPPDQKKWIQTGDFLVEKETWFMATASVMMRKKLVSNLPEWFLHSKSGDIPLYVILAEQGDIAYLEPNMSVYRKNEGGLSYTDSTSSEEFLNNRIFMYSKINEYSQFKYDSLIRQIVFEYKLLLIHSSRNQKNAWRKAYFFLKAMGYKTPASRSEWKYYLKTYGLPLPILKIYHSLRKIVNVSSSH